MANTLVIGRMEKGKDLGAPLMTIFIVEII